MAAAGARVSVFSAGDVFPDTPDGRASFAPLEPLFASAGIVFGNCEGVYSDRPAPSPAASTSGRPALTAPSSARSASTS